ncbi:regulatory subunit of protein kinase a-like protein [Novymonas esmeraldas]|uniref:Regulatory subunit of protein kinase a-like protein n=1 Tax=Novymonas esmeraldas TaxID=1808958 RepID=A0AAW0ERZ7_9TRYP
MSSFDKYVAQLVGRMGSSVSKEQREKMLQNIHESIDDYQQLKDPRAAQARRDAEETKKRQSVAAKQQAAALEALEQEQRRKLQRQASLPPLSPSLPKGTPPLAPPLEPTKTEPTPQKRKTSKKRSTASSPNATATLSSTRRSATPNGAANEAPVTARTRARVSKVQVRDIDFGFSKKVDAQLRALGKETPAPASSVAGTPFTGAAAASTATKPPPPANAAAAAPWPARAPPAVPAKAPPAAVVSEPEPQPRASKAPSITLPHRLSPPPLDHAAMVDTESESPSINGMNETLPLTNHPTICYEENFKDFSFGRPNAASDGESDAEKGSTSNEEEAEGREAREEEFIDDREDLRRRTIQMQRPSRAAISDSSLDIDEARIANFPTTPKSQDKVKTISRVLVRHFLFSTLDDSDIAKFASIMDVEKFEAGASILEKGHPNDTFFIVLDGEAETTVENEEGELVTAPLIRGSTFGDLALMYEVPTDAAVVARSAVQCASLERRTYKMIVSRAMEDKRSRYIDFLSSLPLFSGLSAYELEQVAECLKEDVYVEGKRVIAAGVPNHWLHIVMDGTLRVMVPSEETGEMKEVAQLHRGDYAGHIEFIYRHVSVADVMAASATVKTAKLSRRSFDRIPSAARERLIKAVEEEETYAAYHRRMHGSTPPPLDTTPPFDAPPSHLRNSV